MDSQTPMPFTPNIPVPPLNPAEPPIQNPINTTYQPMADSLPVTTTFSSPQVTAQNQQTQAVDLPPLPAQPVLPTVDSTVTPIIAKKGKKKSKIALVFALFLLIGFAGFGGVAAYTSLKTTFNPIFSPILEGFLLTPGQQITSRINYLLEMGAIGIVSELRDANIPVETDFTESEIAFYKKNIGPKITGFSANVDSSVTYESSAPISNVLGINSNPGKIDQAFISEIMSAKNVTIITSGQEYVDLTNRTDIKFKSSLGIQLQLPNSQISTTFDSLILKNQFYVMLKSFPENDFIDFSLILNNCLDERFY